MQQHQGRDNSRAWLMHRTALSHHLLLLLSCHLLLLLSAWTAQSLLHQLAPWQKKHQQTLNLQQQQKQQKHLSQVSPWQQQHHSCHH